MKNKLYISLTLTVVSVIATVFLFYYWTNEESRNTLFTFNLVYAIFLEILFFGFIYFAKFNSKKVLGATYSVLGTIISFYLLFGIVILLGFNIFLVYIISIKWYYSTIIIGSLLTFIVSGFSLKLNNNLLKSMERENKITETRDSYIQNLTYLQNAYKNILSENKINEKFESGYSSIIEKLTNKLSFINPKNIENPSCNKKLNDSVDALDKLIKEMKKSDSDKISIHKQITEIVNDSIFYLNSLK